MVRLLLMLLAGIAVSRYMFTFFFNFLPMLNTKNILSICGFVLIVYHIYTKRIAALNNDIIKLFLFSLFISLVSFFTMVYNDTNDNSYVSYTRTFIIWTCAAYFVCYLIRIVHGKVTFVHLANYMIAVCVAQSFFALMIEYIPEFKNLVNTYIEQDQKFLEDVDRMYGIGASVDVAGTRFASVLIITSVLISKYYKLRHYNVMRLYIVAFMIISVVGNMIARTTSIGMIIGILFLTYSLIKYMSDIYDGKMYLKQFVIIFSIGILTILILYNIYPEFASSIRFAFEGFFNLFEKGKFTTASSDRLFDVMYSVPDNLKTWIIGDGYFSNPKYDPYYIGELTGGYYKGTDAGYMRFIYYFGLIGLILFMVFISYTAVMCLRKNPSYNYLFIMLLLLNFVIWIKVSTDIFLIFMLFFWIDKEFSSKIIK